MLPTKLIFMAAFPSVGDSGVGDLDGDFAVSFTCFIRHCSGGPKP